MLRGLTGGEWEADCSMSYISVSEEEGAEPIELPTEEDGTGQSECCATQSDSSVF